MGAYEYQNLPPVAVDDSGTGFTTDQDTPFTTVNVFANDSDPNADPITFSGYDGSLTQGLVGYNCDGTFEYDPNDQFNALSLGESAIDTFTYTISDGLDGVSTAVVTITVTAWPGGLLLYLPVIELNE
jgi:VCBS repeat-containing protein